MFQNIVNKYNEKHDKLKDDKSICIQRLKAMNLKMTNDLLQKFNDPVVEIQTNQNTINNELKELREECQKFLQHSDSWINLHKQLNNAFKELGDLVNWSNEIEGDLENQITLKKSAKNKLAEEDNQVQASKKAQKDTQKPPDNDIDLV